MNNIHELSDIHVDFDYTPGSQSDCSQPLCCRGGQPGEYIQSFKYFSSLPFGSFILAPGHKGAGFW